MGYPAIILNGKEIEPEPQHENAVRRTLIAEYLVQDIEHAERPEYDLGSNTIRIWSRGMLHACLAPKFRTILNDATIGCKSFHADGTLELKIWIQCLEQTEQPEKSHTVVLDNVHLPAQWFRTKKK